MILGELRVVDAEANSEIDTVGGSRNQDAFRASRQMRGCLVLGGENTRALQRDVYTQFLVWQLRRTLDRRYLNGIAVDNDLVAIDLHFRGKAAMHGIIAQQMGIGFHRAKIVYADDHDV